MSLRKRRNRGVPHLTALSAIDGCVEGWLEARAPSALLRIRWVARRLARNERGSLGPERPSPRQSEVDIGRTLGPDAKQQVSYHRRKEARHGAPGSTRPDFTLGGVCVEVKNYDLAKNVAGLIRDAAGQAIRRQAELPAGMKQTITIDTRGQSVDALTEHKIRNGIVRRSNGAIDPNAIRFFPGRQA